MKRKKREKTSNIILTLIFLAGLSLLLYPTVSDWWNATRQTKAIASYIEEVEDMSGHKYDYMWKNALTYNEQMGGPNASFSVRADYEKQLDIDGTGIMGYVDIPSIRCYLPVYHGTDEEFLQIAIGHLDWTSLPVGGKSSHCVISGHRGLPRAKLFTNLDQMKEGDVFMLHVLDETLTYEVDLISIIEPEDIEPLLIEKNKDLCTLMTCTPYGVNSHRLLVRGHRIENLQETNVSIDAVELDSLLVASILLIPILFISLMLIWIYDWRKR